MDSKTYSARTTYIYIKKLILPLDYTKIKPQNNQKHKKKLSCRWKIDLNLKSNVKSSISLQDRDV